ncbi:glycosyltransferase [Geobacter luticola]|uniref:Glycosyltransferase n=2 Tax=Geomobilimonas luticola TaxID=1114878 RepID=A0ABS5SFS2_9BACT|nr:glycosyltransferase [Geomobilimonas luticola]
MEYEDLSCLEEIDADFNIFFRGEFVPETLLGKLRGVKINLSSEPFPRYIDNKLNYTYDSINRYFAFREIKHKKYDYVFHYDEASLPFLKKDGLLLSGAFAFPVATEVYKPLEIEKSWDLFFIGRSTKHREEHFSYLKHIYNFLHIAHGIWGPPLVEYVNMSKICLNIHAENEVSWEPRLQMLLASGAFVISEKITPNTLLRPGVDYVEISSPRELRKAVEYYLTHPDERKRISDNGLQRVKDLLDAKDVFSRLLSDLGENRYPKFDYKQSDFRIFSAFRVAKRVVKRLRSVGDVFHVKS